jgi:acetoin utilization deacetylase AcuC-like enzyme
MKVAFDESYIYSLPAGHRFPMEKYDLLRSQLLYEGTVSPKDLFTPTLADEHTLLLTHSEDYLEKLFNQSLSAKEVRRIGFPMTPRLVHRGRIIANGTLQCAHHAIQDGISLNIAGGTHHAFADHGEGFCVFNDIAIAVNSLLHHDVVRRILIIDLDVHQGNGTAHIFKDRENVFTFSMHGEKNYPLKKEISTMDIELPDNTDDKIYLDTLRKTIPTLFEKAEPDLVFYLSGVDVLKTDKLGRLNMTIQGCRERDKMVMEYSKNLGVPVAVSMGGGYSLHVRDIIEAHANTFRVAREVFE